MKEKFFNIVRHPFKFRLFLLSKLPSAFFSGVRVRFVDNEQSVVTIPFKWFTTNPFRSTYFACLSMAAEMSTGVLAMANTYEVQPAVSLLVLKIEGNFMKKADGLTTFTCEDGRMVERVVNEATASGKPGVITMRSVGKNTSGDTVAEFAVTWSFKVKTS